jgi:hypothetical protein
MNHQCNGYYDYESSIANNEGWKIVFTDRTFQFFIHK